MSGAEQRPFQPITISEIEKEYPYAVDHIRETGRAQIYDGRRLMSAEEKVALFGGVDNVLSITGGHTERIVLQACRSGIMTGSEVRHFAELIGQRRTTVHIFSTIGRLMESGSREENADLERFAGVCAIFRPAYSETGIYQIYVTAGFLTNDHGIRRLVRQPKRQRFFGLGGVLQPVPETL